MVKSMVGIGGKAFKGKSVLITGASSGIGEALAREFAKHGAALTLAARREDRLESLAEELRKGGARAQVVRCDVTRDGDLERTVAQAVEAYGKLDVAVANAGYGVSGAVETLTLDDFRRQFETNVFGLLRTVYAALPELKRSRGVIALMGSVASYVAVPGAAPYSMSKFAVRSLAEAMRHELAPEGVAVTLISPGFVVSEIHQVDNRGQHHDETQHPMPDWLRMPADQAARRMVRAIARRESEEVVTMHGKAFVMLQRHTPWVMNLVKSLGYRGRPEPGAGKTTNVSGSAPRA